MSSATDSGMFKTMGLVMGALSLFAIIIALAARLLGDEPEDPTDPVQRNALIQRIEPLASVRTSADDLPAGGPVATIEVAGAPKTGEELVNGACAACHQAGVAEAPLLGDEAAWATRREAGLDALVASVINGKGSMPARGGSAYTDDEIRRAVEHIALFEVDESAAAPAPAGEAASATAEAAPAAEAAPEVATDAAAEEQAAEETAAPAADAAAALVVGQVPDGISDNVKNTVDGLCVSCHVAGVANAPKIGDTVAWQERADKGLNTLTASVINGLNAMPPRGGSTLTDDEIPIAIQYLMSK